MHQMLAPQIVVNIDDQRNTRRIGPDCPPTLLIPRKLHRASRILGKLGLVSQTSESFRDEWMYRTITDAAASHVLVHYLDYAVSFDSVWKRLDIPVLVHCHGFDITWDGVNQATGDRVHQDCYRDQVRALSDNVWFIANSSHTRSKLVDIEINPAKIFVKRFGVPLAPKPPALDAVARSSVLFLGRLVDFKGPTETVQAFASIARKHSGVTLDIAGDGPMSEALDQTIRETATQGCVQRHGVVDVREGKRLRDQAALFTAHNHLGKYSFQEEAFGVSLLEAMGDGIPVVTGRSGGIVDFVDHEANGLLFEPGDIDAHASMLDDLLSSTRKRNVLGHAAWETVRDNFQDKHEMEDFMTALDQTAERHSAATVVPAANRRAA